ncbi:GTPase [Pantoea sp. 18069]|uniref:GTPase n=1 Tax=Pantoea sp. 18069 TaxID=2681415 RepID=UPI00135B29BA|nr:GTPase [Pantoea sp. 18069]
MMPADSLERQLIDVLDAIALHRPDPGAAQGRMGRWFSELTQAMRTHSLPGHAALGGDHALAQQREALNAALTSCMATWERQWHRLAPAQALAQSFEDHVMLLVFGKFNAGKSSLCNLLAERFAAHGRSVHFFRLSGGRVEDVRGPLPEGATETTACVQGVRLGERLVLLDTPGLHSVTPENAELTQCFTDSADGVLWLTSSTSPGQVQELGELARELHRHKPLLPLITRSDVIEEDEVDGEIVKRLRNKSAANRRLQQEDVQARAQQKLQAMGVAPALLKPAVSLSAHVIRAQGQTPQALSEGGLTRLYAALLEIVEAALRYKQRKPAEVLLHHLEETVLHALEQQLCPGLALLGRDIVQERERLRALQPRLVQQVLRQVLLQLAALLQRWEATQDLAGLCGEIDALAQSALGDEIAARLGGYACAGMAPPEPLRSCLPPGLGYEVFYADQAPAHGCAQGAAPMFIGHASLHAALQDLVGERVARQCALALARCHEALDQVGTGVRSLEDCLLRQRAPLLQIRDELRT